MNQPWLDDPTRYFSSAPLTVGVIGLGYVGLPLAVAAGSRGLSVIGYDVNEKKIQALNTGKSHVEDVQPADLADALANGVEFSSAPDELRRADVLIIAVPSPLGRNRQPEMSYIRAAADLVSEVVRPGQLVSLESTTYPGTTEEYLVPAVEKAGLILDRDAFVCFSPERVDPGNVLGTAQIPKVVGGATRVSGEVGAAVYRRLVDAVHLVSSSRTAELTKLLENTYRAVNIALVNELAQLANTLDIDIWETIDAAATKPFGYQAFYPGPGVGGHCIPLDPQFLAWRAREVHGTTRFIDLAEDVNLRMPDYVVARAIELLNELSQSTRGARVLGVGLSYKPNVADDRESPAVEVLTRLRQRGANVLALDPHVSDERIHARGFVPIQDDPDPVHIAIILTDHAALDYEAIASNAKVVFDCRGVYRRMSTVPDNLVVL